MVADAGVRVELVRAANPPVPRTCPYREPVDLRSLRADPSTSDCLDEGNESAVTDVTNAAIQIQIWNQNRPGCAETRRNRLSRPQLRRSERLQPTAQAVGSRPTPRAQAPEGAKETAFDELRDFGAL